MRKWLFVIVTGIPAAAPNFAVYVQTICSVWSRHLQCSVEGVTEYVTPSRNADDCDWKYASRGGIRRSSLGLADQSHTTVPAGEVQRYCKKNSYLLPLSVCAPQKSKRLCKLGSCD